MEIQNRIKLTFHYSAIKHTIYCKITDKVNRLTFHYSAIKPNLEDLGGKLETVLTFHYSAINRMI